MLADFPSDFPSDVPSDVPPATSCCAPPAAPTDAIAAIRDALAGSWMFDGVAVGSPDKAMLPPVAARSPFSISLSSGLKSFALGSATQWSVDTYDATAAGATINGTMVDDDLVTHMYSITVTIATGSRKLVCCILPATTDIAQTSGADSGTWTAHDM